MNKGANLTNDAGADDFDGGSIFAERIGDDKGTEVNGSESGTTPVGGDGFVVDDDLLFAFKNTGFGGGTSTTTNGLSVFLRLLRSDNNSLRLGDWLDFGGDFFG